MPMAAKPIAQLLRGETKFGRLNFIKEVAPKQWRGRNIRIVLCRCDCGNTLDVRYASLVSGKSKSCGCVHSELSVEKAKLARAYWTRHGQASSKMTSEYHTWTSMKYRCHTQTSSNYTNYGGRGISVCQQWRDSFEVFFADMGLKPSPDHSIDRIDNDGNYEPGNCRWATRSEQQRNRRCCNK